MDGDEVNSNRNMRILGVSSFGFRLVVLPDVFFLRSLDN